MTKNTLSGPIAQIYKNWTPHPVQVQILQKLFSKKYKDIFVSVGRKGGKTEVILCALWHTALEKAKSTCFYITPSLAEGARILWHNNRLQDFGPQDQILRIDNENNIIHLKNGSMIVMVGSGKASAASGLTPDLIIYDEFAEFNPSFDIEMQPNRAVHNCPILYVGTLPLVDSRNREQYLDRMKAVKKDPQGHFASYPSWSNPHISKEFLKKKKEELFSKGLDYLWYLQYASKYVVGGKNAIFPMFKKEKHVIKNISEFIDTQIGNEYYLCMKPSNITKSGALFISYNPSSKKVCILDEFYCDEVDQLSTQNVIPKLQDIASKLLPNKKLKKWTKICSKKNQWFISESNQFFNQSFFPTGNSVEVDPEHGISLIKDMFNYDLLFISENCKNFIHEVQYYVVNSKGNLKGNADTLIHCLRYFLDTSYYNMKEVVKKKTPQLPKRPSDWDDILRTRPFSGDLELVDWTDEFD